MHVLATFLGGGLNRQYQNVRYAFSRDEMYETPLFGWALLEYLCAEKRPAEKLVVFGTPTSLWEHLLMVACPEHEAIEILAELAQRGVSRRNLEVYESAILAAVRPFGVTQVHLEPIGFLETTEQQTHFIGQLADLLSSGDRLTLDITHGLRHQPILCTVAAMVLRAAQHARIEGIYYGARELTPRTEAAETPVLRLDPLLAFADWIAALAEAEATGDYGAIGSMFRQDGVSRDACAALAEGFFFHAIGNFDAAADQFKVWKEGIGKIALRGPSALFVDEINFQIDLVMGAVVSNG